MTNLENFAEDKIITHDLGGVYAFITYYPGNPRNKHLYVVGGENTVIDLSDCCQEEYHGFDTVEEIVEEHAGQEILEVFNDFDDFSIYLNKVKD